MRMVSRRARNSGVDPGTLSSPSRPYRSAPSLFSLLTSQGDSCSVVCLQIACKASYDAVLLCTIRAVSTCGNDVSEAFDGVQGCGRAVNEQQWQRRGAPSRHRW